MTITIQPIQLYCSPNDFAPYPSGQPWEVTAKTATTLSFQFQTTDTMGTRRYLVPAGRTVTVKFMRAKVMKLGQLDTAQTFSVAAVPMTEDRSIWTINLTADQASQVVSGTVVFEIYQGPTLVQTIQKAYAVKKISLGTGQGC